MQKISIISIIFASFLLSSINANADGHLKVTDKPLELTIIINHKRFKSYNENWPVEQEARRITNIHLKDVTSDFISKDSDTIGRFIALEQIVESGNIPNIVASTKMKSFTNQYGPKGALLPLNELIDNYAPNLKAFFQKFPNIKSAMTASDGNIYHIPYLPDGKYGRAYFIRNDWLEKLGLEVPNNVEELEKTLIAFKEQDPNGNGLQDETPYFVRHWEELIRLVTLWDGRSSGSDTYYDFYVNDGKVEHPFAMEGYRNGIANIARWYKMGLVDQEVFTRGKKSRDYHMQNNIGGVTHDWFASTSSYNDKLKDKFEGFEFKAFAPPASISGVRMEEHRRTPIKHSGWAIGISNQYPIETIKYFDFWFSKEGRRLANFGVEGEHYDLDENDNAIFKDSMLNGDKPVNNMLYDIGAQLLVRGFYQDFNYEKQWSNKHALEGIALYDEGDYLIDQFLGVSLNSNEQEIYNKYWPKILEYMLERQQAWILGNENVVNDWNAYVYTLNELGLQKVLDVMNIAYLRQYAGS